MRVPGGRLAGSPGGGRRFTPAATWHVSVEMSQPPAFSTPTFPGFSTLKPRGVRSGGCLTAVSHPCLLFRLTAARCWPLLPMQFTVPSLAAGDTRIDLCLLVSPASEGHKTGRVIPEFLPSFLAGAVTLRSHAIASTTTYVVQGKVHHAFVFNSTTHCCAVINI